LIPNICPANSPISPDVQRCFVIDTIINQTHYQSCLSLLEQSNSSEQTQALLLNLAKSALIKHNPKIALQWLKRYAKKASMKPYYPYFSARYFGHAYLLKRNQFQAEKYFSKALALAEKQSNIKRLGISYNDMAAVYRGQGKYGKALEFALKSLKYKTQTGSKTSIANSYANIGQIYLSLKDFEKAEQYLKTALNHVEQDDLSINAHIIWSLATVYVRQDNYELAKYYFSQSEKIYQELGYTQALALHQINYIELLLELKQLEEAKKLLSVVASRIENKGDPRLIKQIIQYHLLNLDFNQAQELASKELEDVDGLEARELHADLWHLLIESLKQQGKFRDAFTQLLQFSQFEKETTRLKFVDNVESLQAEIELYEQTQQLLQLEQTNKAQQQTITSLEYTSIILLTLALLGVVYSYFFFIKRQTERKLLAREVQHHKMLYEQLDQKQKEKVDEANEHQEQHKNQLQNAVVDLMVLCLDLWHKTTSTSKIDFAEQSKIWKVTIDDGRLRTRTLDRYVNINSLPKSPKVVQVLRTGHFVLTTCELNPKDRLQLNELLNSLMQLSKTKV